MVIDAHVHADQYENRVDAIVEIEREHIKTVAVSMDLSSYREICSMADLTSMIIPGLGVHPWISHRFLDRLDEIDDQINGAQLIGEVGLDRLWAPKEYFETQRPVFEYFCRKSLRYDKLMNIHTKDAEAEVLEILRASHIERSIIHWYSGPEDLIKEYLAIGSCFTLSVDILRSTTSDGISSLIPLDRVLLETDNPGGCSWLYERAGIPCDIKEVYRRAAKLYGLPLDEFESVIEQNWLRITSQKS